MSETGEKWEAYPAWYHDEAGEESTTIYNSGGELRLTIRGIAFSGMSFDGLETKAEDAAISAGFTLNHLAELCDCTLEWTMPVPVVCQGEEVVSELRARVFLGAPTANGGIDGEIITCVLRFREGVYDYRDKDGHFESALLGLQQTLPEDTFLKVCINCAYSDYSPYGSSQFGSLADFVTTKRSTFRCRAKTIFSGCGTC